MSLRSRIQLKGAPWRATSVVDINSVRVSIYAPSNGRIPLDVLDLPPLSGDHKYATLVREISKGA